MKIVVGSQSQVKLDAVKSALAELGLEVEVVGVKAKSYVSEQPIDDETITGARNRAAHAKELCADGDLYISIENGVFAEAGGRYLDRAVVLSIARDGSEAIAISDGMAISDSVEFPAASVNEARKRGFATTTVGKVMEEQGIVAKHDDPHLSLSGKPRAEFLKETVVELLSEKLKWTQNVSSAGSSIILSRQQS